MLDPNDSYGMRTRQISRLSPNGHNRRRLAFRARLGERRLTTQLSRSGLVSRTAGVVKGYQMPARHLAVRRARIVKGYQMPARHLIVKGYQMPARHLAVRRARWAGV